jgi:DedD protein
LLIVAKTPISDEELQLRKRARRRLVGAIVLVLLVVVLVPMFLEREPRPQKQDMDIRIPPIPGSTQERPGSNAVPARPSAMTPPQPGSPTSAEAASPPLPTSAPAPTDTRAAKPSPSETRAVAPDKTSPAKPLPTDPAKPATEEGFVIQLGAFSNASNAKQLLKQLKTHKFAAYSEPVKTPKGDKTRVRVGPYPSVEVAEKARERLRALKLMPVSDAKVVRMGE